MVHCDKQPFRPFLYEGHIVEHFDVFWTPDRAILEVLCSTSHTVYRPLKMLQVYVMQVQIWQVQVLQVENLQLQLLQL